MLQRLGQLGLELFLNSRNAFLDSPVLRQQFIRVAGPGVGVMRILDIEVVDGPVVVVAGGLFVFDLLAEFFDMLA